MNGVSLGLAAALALLLVVWLTQSTDPPLFVVVPFYGFAVPR